MRTGTWGKLTAEFADFTLDWLKGMSAIVLTQNSDVDDPTYTEPYGIVSENILANSQSRHSMIKIALTNLRAQIGHAPVLFRALLRLWGAGPTSAPSLVSGAYRLMTQPDWGDSSIRYRDVSAVLPWTGAAYSPLPGVDIAKVPFATLTTPARAGADTTYGDYLDLTDELASALLGARDLTFLLSKYPRTADGSVATNYWYWDVGGRRPHLDYIYQLPVEAFSALPDGTIDLATPLDSRDNLDEFRRFIGWVQRGETGTAVKAFVKNLSGRSIPHLEIFDDHPEWSDPVQVAGTGTGSLGYVTLADAAVSQQYYIKFTSSTAYQVKGIAWRNNPTSLNPTYGTTGWDGATTGDFTAPSGGLTIPSAAWGAGTLVNDEFELSILGNTTDAAWPADANDQVEIANDNGSNAPDAATWRPINGQRTKSTASVTINATTKTISVRRIETAKWVVGCKAFIADQTNINTGIIDSVTATTVVISGLTANSNVYAANAYVGTTLPIRTLGAAVFTQSTAAAGVSQTVKNRIYVEDVTGFVQGDIVFVQDIDNPEIGAGATIATGGVGSTYLDFNANMTVDFGVGAVVFKSGSGEAAFWLRPVATLSTIEQRKDFRLNVRT